jgi:hypothetical protein
MPGVTVSAAKPNSLGLRAHFGSPICFWSFAAHEQAQANNFHAHTNKCCKKTLYAYAEQHILKPMRAAFRKPIGARVVVHCELMSDSDEDHNDDVDSLPELMPDSDEEW